MKSSVRSSLTGATYLPWLRIFFFGWNPCIVRKKKKKKKAKRKKEVLNSISYMTYDQRHFYSGTFFPTFSSKLVLTPPENTVRLRSFLSSPPQLASFLSLVTIYLHTLSYIHTHPIIGSWSKPTKKKRPWPSGKEKGKIPTSVTFFFPSFELPLVVTQRRVLEVYISSRGLNRVCLKNN